MYYERESRPIEEEKRWACYLPEGCDWYDFWDGTRYVGGQEVIVDAPLSRIPLFVRAGSILPMAEGLQYARSAAQRAAGNARLSRRGRRF